jgi:hypothetical protein
MRNDAEFCLNLLTLPDPEFAEKVLDLVWRFDFSAPGFARLDTDPGLDSHTLREWMVAGVSAGNSTF